MSNGSQHEIAYVEEGTYGTTPVSPTMQTLRHNSTTLGLSKETLQSEELRADRQIIDFRHGPKQIGGDIPFEVSYGSFDDLLEAVMMGTWENEAPASGTDQLLAGVSRRSFALRRLFNDLTTGNKYHVFNGCEFNSLSLSISPSAMVGGTFTILGQSMATQAAEISGATITPPLTTEPMSAISGSIKEGGSTIAVITEMSLELNNGMEARFVVGSDETIQPSVGRSNASGSITAFFEDEALLNKFISETNSSVDLTLEDSLGNTIRIYLPNIVYTSGQPDVAGEGPISLSMSFQAVYDTTEGSNIVIERSAA